MAKTYTMIPANTFKEIQTNAGVILKSFTPSAPTVKASDVVCATTGGVNFTDTPSYTDYGEDIDNCPANMKELKRLDSHEVKLSGTAVSLSEAFAETLVGTADSASASGVTTVTPRNELQDADFEDIWWVGDYGDGGFVAIELKNALSTAGFALQSTDSGKGNFAFEFTGHYSMENQDEVPYAIYVKAGE